MRDTVANHLVRYLEQRGIRHVFGLCGHTNIAVLSAMANSGIEFIKDVHSMLPELPILVLSMHDEMLYAERVIRTGARGYLMKDAGPAKLLEVIRLILSGGTYVSQQISACLLDAMAGRRPRGSTSPIEKLTNREFEVFRLLGAGMSTKDVARTLHLSAKTVDAHRARIKAKLTLKDAASLIHHAVRWVETEAGPGPIDSLPNPLAEQA